MDSKITIIVPVYNAEAFLKESLNSIIRQTDKEWTCLLINDGSTDGSQSIIDEYCIADGRFIGLSKQNEGGCAKAKYYGVKHAKTEFIMIVDADDILGDEDYIEKLKRRQCETNADSVLSRTCCFENEKTNVLWTLPDDQVDCNQIIDGETACLLTMPNWHIGLNGRLERKELYDSFSEGDWAYIDEVHGRELLLRSAKVAFAEAIYYYRSNPSSISRKLSPYIFDWSINDALLARFAQEHFPENKTLKNELANRHFTRLVSDIISYGRVKDEFSREERNRIEKALKQSYHYINISEVMKRKPLKGMAVVFLRPFSRFQRLVVSLSSIKQRVVS